MKQITTSPCCRFARMSLLALIACIVPLTANATIATYTDRAAFMAALGISPTITEMFTAPMTFAVGDNFVRRNRFSYYRDHGWRQWYFRRYLER